MKIHILLVAQLSADTVKILEGRCITAILLPSPIEKLCQVRVLYFISFMYYAICEGNVVLLHFITVVSAVGTFTAR